MPQLNPTIKLEQELGQQIYQALQGSVVNAILKSANDGSGNDYWRNRMEGHCMKVEEDILPDFYKLCQEVKQRLGFEEPVDFYVTGDSSINAFSVASEEEGEPHIVNVNSAMFGLMSEDELRFVVGHELGHIINKDTALKRLIYFVFPPEHIDPPMILAYKIRLHDQLAELVADRYGFWANGNLNACVSAFFKMASGLDFEKMNVSIEAYLANNKKRLKYFLEGKGLNSYDHPVNPVRVEAIRLFATSGSEEALEKEMEDLIQCLLKIGNSPIDEHLAIFIASAGLLVANADDKVSEKEVEHILQHISGVKIFPTPFLDAIAKANVEQLFEQSVHIILTLEPAMRENLLAYVISLVISDKQIANDEISFVYGFGKSLNFSEKEISQQFAAMIQRNFTPSFDAIC